MKVYWNYFLYVLEHKVNVFMECVAEGLYLQALTHDMSKLSPQEFIAYSIKFYSKCPISEMNDLRWKFAWLHHQHHNKHHWEYWVVNPTTQEALPMPKRYVAEMVCDWRSFSRRWGRRTPRPVINLLDRIIVHPDTRRQIEAMLERISENV